MKQTPMKKPVGIRARVMLYLAGFVAFVVLLLWVFQMVLLDDFYRWDQSRQVRRASDAVVENMDSSQLGQLIEHLANRNDVCILLLDEKGRVLRSSDDFRFCLIHRMSPQNLSYWCSMAPEDGGVLTELFNMQPRGEPPVNPRAFRGDVPEMIRKQHQNLLCVRRVSLADGSQGFLLIDAMITPLDSTVETLLQQLVVITATVLVGALVLAWQISRRVARPIIETNEAARQLARGRYEPPENGGEYREMAELNETLSGAARELGQVERLQHELIANISHDLRTPLTMIGGYAEMIRDIPGESTPENMQIIIDETNRLNSLVSELLDFSRLQTGHAEMELAPFDLTESVEAIVQRVSKLVDKDGYTVRFAPEGHVRICADEKRIGQVVYNLLGNALTYTGNDKCVTLTQTIEDGRVRISVQDTGKGIAPEELPRIWHRYYRTRESHKRAVIGSGLGLSIVQSILEKHGMRYGVDSVMEQGTTFWFETETVNPPESAKE